MRYLVAFPIMNIFLLQAAILNAVTGPALGQSAISEKRTGYSTILMQENLKELLEQRKEIKNEIQELEIRVQYHSQFDKDIKDINLNISIPANLITNLKKSYNDLANADPGEMLYSQRGLFKSFSDNFYAIDSFVSTPFMSVQRDPDQLISNPTPVQSLMQNIRRNVIRNIPRDLNQDEIRILVEQIPYDGSIVKSEIQEYIDNAKEEVNSFNIETIREKTLKLAERYKSVTLSMLNAFSDELENRKNNLKILEEEIEQLSVNIGEEKQTKSAIDQKLIYAIYMMIGALLLMFLALRVFQDNVAISLIEKRSLVEMVGMAFMLITIIILGTGERIGSETLGTLLGTIAGYVFGRIGANTPT